MNGKCAAKTATLITGCEGDAGEGDEDGGVLIRVIEPQTAMSLANSANGIITQMPPPGPIRGFATPNWPGFAAVWRFL